MTVLRWLGRALAAALEGLATLLGVGRRSPRRALMDRMDKSADQRLFPSVPRRADGSSGRQGSDWAP